MISSDSHVLRWQSAADRPKWLYPSLAMKLFARDEERQTECSRRYNEWIAAYDRFWIECCVRALPDLHATRATSR